MVSYTIIAPLGDNMDALYIGLRHFPTRKIILLYQSGQAEEVAKIREEMKRFRLPVDAYELHGDLIESMFEILSGLKRSEGEETLFVNVSTGDKITTCAALSACYVNGVRAFAVIGNDARLLPMLRFSYSKVISESKMRILKELLEHQINLDDLSRKLKMSPPLLSYHLNGDKDSFGLVELGLVETIDQGREKTAQLTSMGRLFVKGYL